MGGDKWEAALSRMFSAVPMCTIVKTTAPVRVVRFNGTGKRHTGEFTGYFERKGQCDFEGGWRGRMCSFEAKDTESDRISWVSSIKQHQRQRIADVVGSGGIGGLLLSFNGGTHCYLVSWHEFIFLTLATSKKSITVNWCETRVMHGKRGVTRLNVDAACGMPIPYIVHGRKLADAVTAIAAGLDRGE